MIDRYVAYLKHELNSSACTVSAYSSDLRQLNTWLTGQRDAAEAEQTDFSSVTLADLRAWLAQLGAQGLSARSLRRKAQAARSFFRFLLREGVISRNPAADLILPKLPRPLPSLLKEEELEAVVSDRAFDTADWAEYRDRLIIEILYATGLRRSELLHLRDSDISFARREVKVLGKGRKERIVPLAPQLCERIRRYQQLRDERWSGGRIPEPGMLLYTNKGRAMNNSALSRIVKVELNETTGKKTPHVLRHTFATALLRDGAEINSVKELLGHASLATTQIYTHLSFSELQHNYKLAHPRAAKNTNHHGSKD